MPPIETARRQPSRDKIYSTQFSESCSRIGEDYQRSIPGVSSTEVRVSALSKECHLHFDCQGFRSSVGVLHPQLSQHLAPYLGSASESHAPYRTETPRGTFEILVISITPGANTTRKFTLRMKRSSRVLLLGTPDSLA